MVYVEGKTDLSVPLRCSRVMVKMAWDREDAAFMAVEPTVREEFPSSRQPTISLAETTRRSVNPTIWNTAHLFLTFSTYAADTYSQTSFHWAFLLFEQVHISRSTNV